MTNKPEIKPCADVIEAMASALDDVANAPFDKRFAASLIDELKERGYIITRTEPAAPSSDTVENAVHTMSEAAAITDSYDIIGRSAYAAFEILLAHIAAQAERFLVANVALAFYADSANYKTRWTHGMFECQDCGSGTIIDDDLGDKARAALAKTDGKAGEL